MFPQIMSWWTNLHAMVCLLSLLPPPLHYHKAVELCHPATKYKYLHLKSNIYSSALLTLLPHYMEWHFTYKFWWARVHFPLNLSNNKFQNSLQYSITGNDGFSETTRSLQLELRRLKRDALYSVLWIIKVLEQFKSVPHQFASAVKSSASGFWGTVAKKN